ncbi:MAG TPA: hypothetical protein VMD91_08980 [Candidatus Sulfotelmatobacter sp.]|nr:hypothetical protein [Candidatus Sulfotelmatobacter sp.]
MQTVFALIFSYLIFITRTWAITRAIAILDVALALVYDFTPLRLHLGYVETAVLSATFVLWLVNLLVDRGPKTHTL